MRNVVIFAFIVVGLHFGYHYLTQQDLRLSASQVTNDYSQVISWLAGHSKPDSDLSYGALGLRWGSSPSNVTVKLGQPDSQKWRGNHFQVSYESEGLFLQFFTAERRQENAKLFSIRSSSPKHHITENVRVGQHFEDISSALSGEVTKGHVHTIFITQEIRLLCQPNSYGECEKISVINQGAKT